MKLSNLSFNLSEFHKKRHWINAESSAPNIDTNKNSIETIYILLSTLLNIIILNHSQFSFVFYNIGWSETYIAVAK
jgi:hypothetical protein